MIRVLIVTASFNNRLKVRSNGKQTRENIFQQTLRRDTDKVQVQGELLERSMLLLDRESLTGLYLDSCMIHHDHSDSPLSLVT